MADTCTVSGSIADLGADPLPNIQVAFTRSAVAGQGGVVAIPQRLVLTSGAGGAIEGDFLPGPYLGAVTVDGRRVRFRVTVPEAANANLADLIDGPGGPIDPQVLADAIAARDEVVAAVAQAAQDYASEVAARTTDTARRALSYTRAAAATFVGTAEFAGLADGTPVLVDGLRFAKLAGATTVSDLNGLVPAGALKFRHWPATDAGRQAALTYISTLGLEISGDGETLSLGTMLTLGGVGGRFRDVAFLRTGQAAGTAMVYVTGTKFFAENVTVDGAKAAVSAACSGLQIGPNVEVAELVRCGAHRMKASGGFGVGFLVDEAPGNRRRVVLQDCTAFENDAQGLSALRCQSIEVEGGEFSDNGNSGVKLTNYSTDAAAKLRRIRVSGVQAHRNGAAGIEIGDLLEDENTAAAFKLFGYGTNDTFDVDVDGCTATSNTGYGLALCGDEVRVRGNLFRGNGGSSSIFGGAVISARYGVVEGNVFRGNRAWGLDSGGLLIGSVSGNIIAENGQATGTTGLNIGATQDVTYSGNVFYLNSNATGYQIGVNNADGGAAGEAFPLLSTRIAITANTFSLTSTRRGIRVLDGVSGVTITHNIFQGGDPAYYVLCLAKNPRIFGNRSLSTPSSRTLALGASSELVVPDIYDDILVNTATPIEGILTASMAEVGRTGIAWIEVTAGGTGYGDGLQTVTITGGGTGATAVAWTRAGVIIGVKMTAYGSGYTSQPTISVAGGTGATFAAQIGVLTPDRPLRIFATQRTTIRRTGLVGPDVLSAGTNDIIGPAGSYLELHGTGAGWRLAGSADGTVDAGSGAQGTYYRMADGRQVCLWETTLPYVAGNYIGRVWGFPAQFKAGTRPHVSVTLDLASYNANTPTPPSTHDLSQLMCAALSNTSASPQIYRKTGTTNFDPAFSVAVVLRAEGVYL